MGQTVMNDQLADLRERERICWLMASVFLANRDAHGCHDMGVEIQALQMTIRELTKATKTGD
jgi:hypothetical protein